MPIRPASAESCETVTLSSFRLLAVRRFGARRRHGSLVAAVSSRDLCRLELLGAVVSERDPIIEMIDIAG